jgi:hypothetical protein
MKSKNMQPGIKTTRANRPKFLETMQTRLNSRSIAIRSRRFVKELKGFIFNAQTKRAEASRGFHDDAIIALCLALYAKGTMTRNVPIGFEDEEMTEAFKAEIYEEIKKELEREAPEDWMLEDLDIASSDFKDDLQISTGYKRAHDQILKEFGWTLIPFIMNFQQTHDFLANLVGNILF